MRRFSSSTIHCANPMGAFDSETSVGNLFTKIGQFPTATDEFPQRRNPRLDAVVSGSTRDFNFLLDPQLRFTNRAGVQAKAKTVRGFPNCRSR